MLEYTQGTLKTTSPPDRVMLKGQHYRTLQEAGLPVPIYGVFDRSCLTEEAEIGELGRCVGRILKEGSGLVGVRTEPKTSASPLGNYPHYMPLRFLEEVRQAIKGNEREHAEMNWWYLVNEAFLDYSWNAVVRVTQRGVLPGHWLLDGEVNVQDSLPLRLALNNTTHVLPAHEWKGTDAAGLRKQILRSGLLENWLEVSKVRTPRGPRLVFWGLRGTRLAKSLGGTGS
jgi:hypothetical protein